MLNRSKDAIREALDVIQWMGYAVIPADDGTRIECLWIKRESAPNIGPLVEMLESDPEVLEDVLKDRTIPVPMFLLLGYPWKYPTSHWKSLTRAGRRRSGVDQAKREYAKACLLYFKNRSDRSWKHVVWREPWPLNVS